MMTKWDTIQADISDAYAYLEEEEKYEQIRAEEIELFGHEIISLDELAEQELTLDWEAYE
jgi:hypothetical protein